MRRWNSRAYNKAQDANSTQEMVSRINHSLLIEASVVLPKVDRGKTKAPTREEMRIRRIDRIAPNPGKAFLAGENAILVLPDSANPSPPRQQYYQRQDAR